MKALLGATGEPDIPVPGLPPGWEPGAVPPPPPPPPAHADTTDAPQTAGERVLARVLALGDDHPSADYRQAIADVLAVLSDCAPECHEEGHR